MTHRLVLDTDVGIDDAMMILAITADPAAEIVAIGSSHGNCSAAQAAANAVRVLDAIGLDRVPVALGLESPLDPVIAALHVHGNDGLGDVGLPPPSRAPSGESAVDQLIRLSREHPGELDLLVVGSLTNVAAALERDPDVLGRFRSVWILGGYSQRPADPDRPSEDFNTFCSPGAAARVYHSGAALNVMPIDTTFTVIFSDAHLERISAARSPAARLASRILPCYLDFYQERMGRRTIPVHDPTAVMALLYPDLVTETAFRRMTVESWLGRHRAVGLPADADEPGAATVVTGVDRDQLLDRLVDAITQASR